MKIKGQCNWLEKTEVLTILRPEFDSSIRQPKIELFATSKRVVKLDSTALIIAMATDPNSESSDIMNNVCYIQSDNTMLSPTIDSIAATKSVLDEGAHSLL